MRKIIRSEMSYSEPVSFDLEVYTMLKREDLDYLEKEIASLKEQLVVITPLRRVLAVTRMANRNNPDIRVTMALNDWDKLTKEIKK